MQYGQEAYGSYVSKVDVRSQEDFYLDLLFKDQIDHLDG